MRTLAAVLLGTFLVTPAFAQKIKNPNVLKMKNELRAAMMKRQLQNAKDVTTRLVAENSNEAVDVLTGQFPMAMKLGDEYYWMLCKGLATFSSKESLDQLGEFILSKKTKPAARDTLFYLQSNYSPYLAPMLLRLVDKGSPSVWALALDHLGTLRQKPSVTALIDRLEKEAKRKSKKAYPIARALRKITNQDFGMFVGAWRNWWLANANKPLPTPEKTRTGTVADDQGGPRKRHGRLRKGDPGEILVIGATMDKHNFDNIASMLRRMGIPHKKMKKKEFNTTPPKLDNVKAIFINCTNFRQMCICKKCTPAKGPKTNRMSTCTGCAVHIQYEDKLTVESVNRIAKWVKKGGYLFTEDLCIIEVLDVGFSQYVKSGPILREQKVPVSPAIGQTSHAYLRRVFAKLLKEQVPQAESGGSVEPPTFRELDIKHIWKIDDESPTITITSKTNVTVLLESKKMAKEHNVDPATAILVGVGGRIDLSGSKNETTFKGGRILHVMSHFTKQNSSRDGYSLQNLMLNFLIECNERWLHTQGQKAMKDKKRR